VHTSKIIKTYLIFHVIHGDVVVVDAILLFLLTQIGRVQA